MMQFSPNLQFFLMSFLSEIFNFYREALKKKTEKSDIVHIWVQTNTTLPISDIEVSDTLQNTCPSDYYDEILIKQGMMLGHLKQSI